MFPHVFTCKGDESLNMIFRAAVLMLRICLYYYQLC